MPTRKGGYFLKDGTKVPSVTTITGRFKESRALIYWAWKEGKEGRDFRKTRDDAADSGTLAHAAFESFLSGTEADQISFGDDDVAKKAKISFSAAVRWAKQSNLRVTHSEQSLVSERYGFGGTLDAVLIGDERAIGDWKTSNGIYPDYRMQIAAYGQLWNENFPGEPITGGFHLLRFDKEYGDYHHHFYPELEKEWLAFQKCLETYPLLKAIEDRE